MVLSPCRPQAARHTASSICLCLPLTSKKMVKPTTERGGMCASNVRIGYFLYAQTPLPWTPDGQGPVPLPPCRRRRVAPLAVDVSTCVGPA